MAGEIAVVARRTENEVLRAQLDNERSTFKAHWRDLSDYILPRRSRFFVSDANKGDPRNQKIIDSTATLAVRTLQAGMMSGITSPARPWFKLTTPDPGLAEFGPVKGWLAESESRMRTMFLRSNLYNALPSLYGDIGTFGTACMFQAEDFNRGGMRFYSFPIGSYMIANDPTGRVNTFYREFRMTVAQLVEEFGQFGPDGKIEDWSNFSTTVRNYYERGETQTWIDVVHAIRPNKQHDPSRLEAKFKKYVSVYYEMGFTGTAGSINNISPMVDDTVLRESGFDRFPLLAPRWEITGEDVYGTNCPGMVALGDIKQLQTGEKRSLQAIDKMINPPMKAHVSMKKSKASLLPGDITYVGDRDVDKSFRPIHEVRFDLNSLEGKQQQVRERISRSFYEDLFLMLAQSDRRQITAREIEERHEEKLLALGPVLEQLNQDLLDPLIDNTFDIMLQQNMLPEPPEELQGVELKVEYISIMAQAQKLIGLSGVERFTGFASQVVQANPESMDKLDTDQLLDVYGEMASIPPGVVRSDEDVAEIREQRAEQQAKMAQMEQAQAAAATAKDLSQAETGGDNVLSRLVDANAEPGQAG